MAEYLLSVVIPTLNRPQPVLRLLESLESQSLPKSDFEVLVVDDGSEPPLELNTIRSCISFAVRVIRRTGDHGAHESRFAGLRQVTGTRVLFLDDDLELSREVLAEHASVTDTFAMGPIYYHPDSRKTPYQRFQAQRYAEYAQDCESQGSHISATRLYICNASGPSELYLRVFHSVAESFGNITMGGDGFDEEMLCLQLRSHERPVQFLSKAVVLHIDNKTVAEACRERTLHGILACRLLLQFPSVKRYVIAYPFLTGGFTSYKTWCARVLWLTPGFLKIIAELLTLAADHGPGRWIPQSICRFPLSFSYLDGMRSVLPSFKSLRAVLLDSSTGSG